MLEELQQRVNRGIALLDEKRPGWADEIDLTILNIALTTTCILGQLFPDVEGWGDKKYQLRIEGNGTGVLYGFVGEGVDEIDLLNKLWTTEIAKRQQGSK